MVGLIDIAPAFESVHVQGAPVASMEISAKGLAGLLSRYPELRTLMTGREVGTDGKEAAPVSAATSVAKYGSIFDKAHADSLQILPFRE